MSSVPRFFVSILDINGNSVVLPPEAAHHARNVLRLQEGEKIQVLPGDGTALVCTLTEVGKAAVVAHADERFTPDTEPETRVTVAQALPKTAEKIEQVLQHGTEIGAVRFVVFNAHRSVARLEYHSEKLSKRMIRWQGIVKSAAEQSGRAIIPDVSWMGEARHYSPFEEDAVFVLHESATAPLRDALSVLPESVARLRIIVGPEGGLTDEEVSHFQSEGAKVVSLGPRILRTETAALVALSQILYARGD